MPRAASQAKQHAASQAAGLQAVHAGAAHNCGARTVTPYWKSAHWLTNLSHWGRYTCMRGGGGGTGVQVEAGAHP